MKIACLNPGSSSLKLSVVEDDITLSAQRMDPGDAHQALESALPAGVDGVAVRVVHGGIEFRQATVVDAGVLARLRELTWLAPLHNPMAIALIERVRELRPELPVAACFDTAFHATIPAAAATYPVPREWASRWGLRRFGFHGLSHAYATGRAVQLLGGQPHRLVVCHLGAGASLCAIHDGRSVDTTMGFTPMEGLMMATRAGSIDPGIILLALRQGLSVDEVENDLERRSGLLGVSGLSADFSEVAAAAAVGNDAAALAIAVYRHRLVQGVAAMAASLGGLDALVFTGGVGENEPLLRQQACAQLGFLGIQLGPENVRIDGEDGRLSAAGSAVDVLVIHAREDLEMARQASALLGH